MLLLFAFSLFSGFFVVPKSTIAASNWWENKASFSDQNTIELGGNTFYKDDCIVNGNCQSFRVVYSKLESAGDQTNLYVYTTTNNLSAPSIFSNSLVPTAVIYDSDAKAAFAFWLDPNHPTDLGYHQRINIDLTNAPLKPALWWPASISGPIELLSRDGSGKPSDNAAFLGSVVNLVDPSNPDKQTMATGKIVSSGSGYGYQIALQAGSQNKGNVKFLSRHVYFVQIFNSTHDGHSCVTGQNNNPNPSLDDWNKFYKLSILLPGIGPTIMSSTAIPTLAANTTQLFKKTTSGEICELNYSGAVAFSFEDNGVVSVGDSSTAFENETNSENLTVEGLSPQTGLNITVTEALDSPLDNAIASTIRMIAKFVQSSLSFVMEKINWLLDETEKTILGKSLNSNTSGLAGPWNTMKNLALTLLVMALIIIAFANVVQVDIEQYGLARMIPKIIISIVMVMASWIIVTFFFDFSAAIQAQAKGITGTIDLLTGFNQMSISLPDQGTIIANIGSLITMIIILIGVLACGIVLFFLLMIRAVFLSFLLVVAPLAMIMNILPFTQGLTKQWWDEFFKWMFMGPVAMAIIAIGEVIAATVGGFSGSDISVTSDSGAVLFGLLIFAASLYMAATLPLSWGGQIMKSWSGVGKGFLGAAQGMANFGKNLAMERSGIQGFFDKRKAKIAGRAANRAGSLQTLVSGKGNNVFRNFLAGNSMNPAIAKAEAKAQREQELMTYAKTFGLEGENQDQLLSLAQNDREKHGGKLSKKGLAAMRVLATRGELNGSHFDDNGNFVRAGADEYDNDGKLIKKGTGEQDMVDQLFDYDSSSIQAAMAKAPESVLASSSKNVSDNYRKWLFNEVMKKEPKDRTGDSHEFVWNQVSSANEKMKAVGGDIRRIDEAGLTEMERKAYVSAPQMSVDQVKRMGQAGDKAHRMLNGINRAFGKDTTIKMDGQTRAALRDLYSQLGRGEDTPAFFKDYLTPEEIAKAGKGGTNQQGTPPSADDYSI